ncbi:unnamed protein product [Caenorhabditis angaria]|uniref:Cation efflux protein transmembrane domain-containing protein n=1 Tax=Caenorhabditis angaria TaxID=860376 RepID=A0A9P1NCK6_9PELO|nr:unnamed protein product [Caenorhabditis angaria]
MDIVEDDSVQNNNKCAHVEKKTEKELKFIGEPISNTSIDLKKVSKKLGFQVSLSLVFFFVELIVGILCKSVALVADSYHMISDVTALVVAFACLRLANKTTKSNTYGLVRMEAVGGLFNGLFLFTVCLSIFQEAAQRLINPSTIKEPEFVMAVGVIGLVINIVGLFLMHGEHGHSHGGGGHGHSHGGAAKKNGATKNHGHSHEKAKDAEPLMMIEEVREKRLNSGISLEKVTPYNGITKQLLDSMSTIDSGSEHDETDETTKKSKKSKKTKNVNIMGVYLHLLSDAIGSVIVILTSIVVIFFKDWRFTPYLDPVLSMCLASMMSVTSIQLIVNASYILLRKSPRGFNVEKLQADVKKINGVVTVNDVKAWPLTGSRIVASVRVLVCNPIIYPSVSKKIKILFHDNGCHSVSIEPTFEEECMQKINEST